MKVLLVADEFFSWGIYGGFGAFTRKLGRELVKHGVEIECWIHQISKEQKPVGETEVIDGVSVKTLPRSKPAKLWKSELYKTDADLIHSQCGMYDTYLAFKRNLDKPKMITIQDLRTDEEYKWLKNLERTSGWPWYKKLWATYVRHCYRDAVRVADIVACQAKLLFPKVEQVYGVKATKFLPNFIDIPEGNFKKADEPTAVWLGRLDPVKQPELCFCLAEKTPEVQFYILGRAHAKYGTKDNAYYQRKYRHAKNLHFMGFTTGEKKREILQKAWVLVNTSAYECLPVSFLEASSYKCALFSTRNPDGYTENFGSYVPTDSPIILAMALNELVKDERWRGLGEKGCAHVKNLHSIQKGVQTHLDLYKEMIK